MAVILINHAFDRIAVNEFWHAQVWDTLTQPYKLPWIHVYKPELVRIPLMQGTVFADFRFKPNPYRITNHDLIDFIYDVSLLRGGNPFRLHFHDNELRKWLRHKFYYTKPKTVLRFWPYERVYAEQGVLAIMKDGV